MARITKLFICVLTLLGLFAVHTASAVDPKALGNAAKKKASEVTVTKWVKPPLKHAYQKLVREALAPQVKHMILRLGQEYGTAFHHKIARAWHTALTFQLESIRLPDVWIKAAAELHRKLGGEGNLVETLHNPSARMGDLNMSKGLLRDEFISYSIFFLSTFVPKTITDCMLEDEYRVHSCILKYKQQLQAALLSTLTSFFQYVIPRDSASRIASKSFVLTAVSPCPFSHLVEPKFVSGALKGENSENLILLASIKRVALQEACPDLKKPLLRVLMINGVTPRDMMKSKKLDEELAKVVSTVKETVDAEREAIDKAASIDWSGLRKEVTDGKLEVDGLRQYLADLKADISGLELTKLTNKLSEEIEAEAEENPQRVPLRPVKTTSPAGDAREVLDKIRRFPLSMATPQKEG